MEVVFSKEIQAGLDAARVAGLRKASRLRISVGDDVFPVLRMSKTGFTVAAQDAPKLRGLVDLYDGANHLFQCLIIAHEQDGAEMRYEFKRATGVHNHAPLDFVKSTDAPAALITDRSGSF